MPSTDTTEMWRYHTSYYMKKPDGGALPLAYDHVVSNITTARLDPEKWLVFEWPRLVLIFNRIEHYVCIFEKE